VVCGDVDAHCIDLAVLFGHSQIFKGMFAGGPTSLTRQSVGAKPL
jgi:hypothetical protein